jgi:hypothetical protein
MPRQLRIEYPGAIYHVMNRGDRHGPIAAWPLPSREWLPAATEGFDQSNRRHLARTLQLNGVALLKEDLSPVLGTNPADG